MRRLALAALLLASPASAHEVHIFAAASLKDALGEIIALWEERTETDAVVTYAGTPQLARQIAEGAPADLRDLRHPGGAGAGGLPAVSRELAARTVRVARRADPAATARDEEPVRGGVGQGTRRTAPRGMRDGRGRRAGSGRVGASCRARRATRPCGCGVGAALCRWSAPPMTASRPARPPLNKR